MPKRLSILLSVALCLLIFSIISPLETQAEGVDCTTPVKTQTSQPYCSGPFSPNGNQECAQQGYDLCENLTQGNPPQYYFRCCNNPPPPPSFNCSNQGGLEYTCYPRNNECPPNWVRASQNPNTSCSSGQTCCWYNPPVAPNCVDSDCNSENCADSGRVCSISTSPCQCVTPAATCSSSNCGACNDCGSCIDKSACGWNGSSCQGGNSSCPTGGSQWYWNSCTTNVCAGTPPPPPPPGPTCGTTCVYQQGSACYSGNCLDGTNNCSFNNNCGFVEGCSAGSQTSCPVQGCGACNAPETA